MKSINLKFLLVFLVSVAVVFSLSACGGSDSDSDDAGATEAAATEAAMTEAPAADATEAPAGEVVAEFPFNNKGSKDICELYLSQDGSNWGESLLGGETLAAGSSFVGTDIPVGTYSVKSVFCNGEGEEVIPDISISN